MKTEYEVRVLDIDKLAVIEKIKSLGGKLEDSYDQKRLVYDFNPAQPSKWIRLRTDGIKTTLAIKEVKSDRVDGTKELEVTVSNFDDTAAILEQLGYTPKGYQENRRTHFTLNGIELDIDEWPIMPAYLEIEGRNPEEIDKVIKLLDLDPSKITSKNVQDIFLEDYGGTLDDLRDVRF